MNKGKTGTWRNSIYNTIYESNTTAGKAFDIALLLLIVASIAVVMLDSIKSFNQQYGRLFTYWNGYSPSCLQLNTYFAW